VRAKLRHKRINYVLALSSSDPFAAVHDIAELTLGEVGTTLRYAFESSKDNFDRASFLYGSQPRVVKIIDALDVASAKSRGADVSECKQSTTPIRNYGNVDALKFVGAMRVFGEWRIPRQVPEGYKGFAVGMNLGYKDVVQNLMKIEQAVHVWLDYHKRLSNDITCSPTLRQVLEHEANTNVHTALPRLKDRTGAMGLLWVRRQLQYQANIFGNILQVPEKFPSTEAGVTAAYKEVYDKYHGW
jgi:Glycolipid transfer protein (GLTP)